MKFFTKTYQSLFKTRDNISNVFNKIFKSNSLSNEDFESIEECLLSADINFNLTNQIIDDIKENKSNDSWNKILYSSIIKNIEETESHTLQKIILMVGINGAGKTTASAKIANYLRNNSMKPILVAADTYRAAAVEQLQIWADRLEIDCIANSKTNDPASIAFDGVKSGISKNVDHIIVDTAGRLQTSSNLMNELQKVFRVVSKISDEISIIINLDANIGQNGIKQVEEFNKYLPIDGVIINKMDGTARGGVALSVMHKYNIPILFLGVGEKVDNLVPFDIDKYINSLVNEK